jgi:hypothetical protein
MDRTINEEEQLDDTDDELNAQRSVIRQFMDDIVNQIGREMRTAGLSHPLGLTIPRSGQSIVIVITPDDPNEADWEKSSAIIRRVVSGRLGGLRLRSRNLLCAMVPTPTGGANITANSLSFGET